ncbi:Aquaporin-1 [Rhizina undulata]
MSRHTAINARFFFQLGEFVGGTKVANTRNVELGGYRDHYGRSDTSILLYIALSFGFSLAVNAWVFFPISGGLFNPTTFRSLLGWF